MATSIYVGNLSWSATQDGVEALFKPYGDVLSVNLISDRETGRARGFGFVEMEDADAINAVIDQAVAEADEKGIHGKQTTPFLLAKVKEITGGDSLEANIQLVFNNAKLAAQTAVAYSALS